MTGCLRFLSGPPRAASVGRWMVHDGPPLVCVTANGPGSAKSSTGGKPPPTGPPVPPIPPVPPTPGVPAMPPPLPPTAPAPPDPPPRPPPRPPAAPAPPPPPPPGPPAPLAPPDPPPPPVHPAPAIEPAIDNTTIDSHAAGRSEFMTTSSVQGVAAVVDTVPSMTRIGVAARHVGEVSTSSWLTRLRSTSCACPWPHQAAAVNG